MAFSSAEELKLNLTYSLSPLLWRPLTTVGHQRLILMKQMFLPKRC